MAIRERLRWRQHGLTGCGAGGHRTQHSAVAPHRLALSNGRAAHRQGMPKRLQR